MHILKPNEYQLFEYICGMSEKALLKTMSSFLNTNYSNVISTRDYIIATGNIPVAIVAHLDTVFPTPAKNIYYDRQKNVIWSSEGLGADDRAGVFGIIKLIKAGYRPHIIFTTGEESGGLGATQLVMDYPDPPFDVKYIIELDRQGVNDCVFYNCGNEEFISYVETFGFVEDIGTFSDISVICPEWEIAGVNLSIGYKHEHTYVETFHINAFNATIQKVSDMLLSIDTVKEPFKYIPGMSAYYQQWYNANAKYQCCQCKKSFTEYELFPTKTRSRQHKNYCADCMVNRVSWCEICAEPFEVDEYTKNLTVCYDCLEDAGNV